MVGNNSAILVFHNHNFFRFPAEKPAPLPGRFGVGGGGGGGSTTATLVVVMGKFIWQLKPTALGCGHDQNEAF